MRIIFTRHARMRMQERNITEKEVTECVFRPDRIMKDVARVCHFQKSVSYGTLEVVGRHTGAYLIVIKPPTHYENYV